MITVWLCINRLNYLGLTPFYGIGQFFMPKNNVSKQLMYSLLQGCPYSLLK